MIPLKIILTTLGSTRVSKIWHLFLDILTLQDRDNIRTFSQGEKQARPLFKSLLFNLFLKIVQSNVIFSDNVHYIVYLFSSRYKTI